MTADATHAMLTVVMLKAYYVYIVTNKRNGTLYVGMTNDLSRRCLLYTSRCV